MLPYNDDVFLWTEKDVVDELQRCNQLVKSKQTDLSNSIQVKAKQLLQCQVIWGKKPHRLSLMTIESIHYFYTLISPQFFLQMMLTWLFSDAWFWKISACTAPTLGKMLKGPISTSKKAFYLDRFLSSPRLNKSGWFVMILQILPQTRQSSKALWTKLCPG